jgi:hypothetical protein
MNTAQKQMKNWNNSPLWGKTPEKSLPGVWGMTEKQCRNLQKTAKNTKIF